MTPPVEPPAPVLTELAPVRAAAYAFLSRAFHQPATPDLIVPWADPAFAAEWAEFLGEEGVARLHEFARAEPPLAERVREVSREFTALFLVPGTQGVAPYESVLRGTPAPKGGSTGRLMGRAALAVQRWYRLAAQDISPDFNDLPDHIALELAFVARLAQLEGEFHAAGDFEKQTRALLIERDFLAAHVVSWTAPFTAAIRSRTRHPWFLGLATILETFPAKDLARLEDILGPAVIRDFVTPGTT